MARRGGLAADGEGSWGPLSRRQQPGSTAPCPSGNGTTIGTFQQFTVLCNTNVDGDVLDRPQAFDFVTCADICSSFHPRCDAVTYDGFVCTLRAGLRPGDARPARRTESAVASFPGASSNCVTLGGSQSALGTSFNTMCGFVIAGFDLAQNYAPTFQDCLGQCAGTSGCAAVSFDPSQELGFKNCYLKTTVSDASTVAVDRRSDSAFVAGTGPAGLPSAANPAAGGGVATLPVSNSVGSGAGLIFFTPPGGGGGGGSANTAATPAASSTIPAGAPSPVVPTLEPSSAADLFPTDSLSIPSFFFPGATSTALPESAATAGNGEDPEAATAMADSNAWIAAPVVGSVAAIALIVISFVMLKRRRRGAGSASSSVNGDAVKPRKSMISRPWPISSRFTAWLPGGLSSSSFMRGSGAKGDNGREGVSSRGSGGRRTAGSGMGMGNYSEVNAGPGSRASVRDSVANFIAGRPAGSERLEDIEEGGGGAGGEKGKGDTPVYEIKNGRPELRNSMNGLGQNRWS